MLPAAVSSTLLQAERLMANIVQNATPVSVLQVGKPCKSSLRQMQV